MELIYLWVKEYKNIKMQGFNFSSKFTINTKMKPNDVDGYSVQASIEDHENKVKLFGENIVNINAIIGKNGTGKSSILELLATLKDNREKSFENFYYYFVCYDGEKLVFVAENIVVENLEELDKSKSYKVTKETKDKLELKILFYSDIINNHNNYNRYNYTGFYNISTGYFLQEELEKIEYETVQKERIETKQEIDIKLDMMPRLNINDTRKQMYFLSSKKELLSKLSYKEYINKLSSIKSIVMILKSQRLSEKANDYIEYTNKLKKLKDLNLSLEDKILEKFIMSLVSICVDKLIINVLDDIDKNKIDKEHINWGIIEESESFHRINLFILEIEKHIEIYDKEAKEIKAPESARTNTGFLNVIKNLLTHKLTDKKIMFGDKEYKFDVRNKFEVEIDFNMNTYQEFSGMLSTLNRYSLIDYNWGKQLSSGELSLLNFMGRFSYISVDVLKPRSKNLLILMDEPEATYHPEWKRKFIQFVNIYFSEIYLKEFLQDNALSQKKNIQIILTSHSPFIASDLPKENIIMLDKDEKTGNCIVVKKKPNTFGANIFELYKDSFFMDSTFGEFGKEKIQEIINLLKSEKNKIDGKVIYENEKEIEGKRSEIEYLINSIGEKLIREKLQKMYDDYLDYKNNTDSTFKIENLIRKSGLSKDEFRKYFSGDKND